MTTMSYIPAKYRNRNTFLPVHILDAMQSICYTTLRTYNASGLFDQVLRVANEVYNDMARPTYTREQAEELLGRVDNEIREYLDD